MTLALLNTLRDIGIGCAIGYCVWRFSQWLDRREREHLAQVEQKDLQDFAEHAQQQSHPRDWEFPPRWRPPSEEYVARPKERA